MQLSKGTYSKKLSFAILILTISFQLKAQMNIVINTTDNTDCAGVACTYSGPEVLINEVMTTPYSGNGSLIGSSNTQRGEWIELYNPNPCDAVDISCFMIGNNIYDMYTNYGGGYKIPAGTIIPPAGFAIIRGMNALNIADSLLITNGGNTVVVEINFNSAYCYAGGNRFWLPDAGGWLVLYDENGSAVDAISWATQSSPYTNRKPCLPYSTSCPSGIGYPSYDQINNNLKEYVNNVSSVTGRTFQRIPDGGFWLINQQSFPSMGYFNDIQPNQKKYKCNGSVELLVTDGTAPYTINWANPDHLTGFNQNNLCSGIYEAWIKDFSKDSQFISFTIEDYKPAISIDPSKSDFCIGDPDFQIDGLLADSCQACIYDLYGTAVHSNYFSPDIAGSGSHYLYFSIIDTAGCKNADSALVMVHSIPNADFSVNNPSQCLNTNLFDFENKSSCDSGELSCSWYFGDGNSDTNYNTSHSFQSYNNYTTSLFIESIFGCKDSCEQQLHVLAIPDADYEINGKIKCLEGNQFLFTSNTSSSDSFIYNWDLGDGSSGSTFQLTHHYESDGIFQVTLILTDSNSCVDTAINTVQVINSPDSGFYYLMDSCEQSVRFITPMQDSVSYEWDFGDNSSSNEDDIKHLFSNTGSYTISLTATVQELCKTITEKKIEIVTFENSIYVPNAFTPNYDGINDIFKPIFSIYCVELELKIYNRWGELIYTSENNGILEWNGTDLKGETASLGVYYYSIRKNGIFRYGTVTLLR